MISTSRFSGIATAAIFMMIGSVSQAYKAIEVGDGGTIAGKISFSGSPPVNPVHNITQDVDYCGASITADYYVIDANGGLKNAVIIIENISKGKAYDKKGIIPFENIKCVFEPHVSVGVKGQKLGIVSRDSILHNTHLYHGPKERTLYNIAIPFKDKIIKKKLKKTGKVIVKCDAHDWMLGYVYVADHPYLTISAADGSFELKDVPAGDYQVKIWHERLGEIIHAVSVTAGGTASLNHSFSQ